MISHAPSSVRHFPRSCGSLCAAVRQPLLTLYHRSLHAVTRQTICSASTSPFYNCCTWSPELLPRKPRNLRALERVQTSTASDAYTPRPYSVAVGAMTPSKHEMLAWKPKGHVTPPSAQEIALPNDTETAFSHDHRRKVEREDLEWHVDRPGKYRCECSSIFPL